MLRSEAALGAVAWIAGLYARFAYATTRWRIEGGEHIVPHVRGEPVIVAFWHERQAMMPMLWVLARRQGSRARVHVLASRHRDGRFVHAIMRQFKMEGVSGSTSRGGAASLRSLCALLAAGDHIAITPDGPRGPAHRAAPGVAQIAALAQVRVLPCAAQSTRRFLAGSWDRMAVPLPFGRGVIVCQPTIAVPRDGWQATLPEIEAAMTAAAERADRQCNAT